MEVRLMSIETLATYLDASPNKVRMMVKEGRLPRPKIEEPRFVRWDRHEVDAMLGENVAPFQAERNEMLRRFGG